jgi:hypothetical protein
VDLRSIQKPLKEKYRSDPTSSRITLRAQGAQSDSPIACSVEVGQKLLAAQAHSGVGGSGTAACSGDLLLGALAACAQLTCHLVEAAMGIPILHIQSTWKGRWICVARWGFQRRCPLVSEHSRQVRNRCARGHAGAIGRVEREN